MASASGATPWWLLLLLLSLLLLLLLSLIAHITRPSAISTWKRPRHRGSRNSQQAWPSNLDVDLANDSTPCGRHRAITSWGHTDGFGAQYAAMLSVFAWSLMHNLTYCSMSWHSMAHDLDAKLMFEFVGGRLFGPPATAATPRLYHAHGEMGCMTGTRVQQKCQYGKVPDARRLARRYYLQAALNRSAELFADSRFFHVAVHVRRGDVTHKLPFRYTGNAAYTTCLQHLRSRFADGRLPVEKTKSIFHIFSEGPHVQLASIKEAGTNDVLFHTNLSAAITFHHLVRADALVMARSSFSWCAGFIRQEAIFSVQAEAERPYMLPGTVSCTSKESVANFQFPQQRSSREEATPKNTALRSA